MKKYAKQIIAWICVMLMTVSMAMPVIADNGGNSNHKNEVYISPMVRNLDFTSDHGNIVDEGTFTLRMEIYNPSPSIQADSSYYILRQSSVTLSDGTNKVDCNFKDMASLRNNDNNKVINSKVVSLRIIVPDAISDGKYKIESVHLKYGYYNNDKEEVIKATKDINLSDLDNQKELVVDVAKPAEGNYPELLNFTYGNVKNPVIVNGDSSVTAGFVMTQKNKVKGTYTHKASNIIFTFKNGNNSFTTSCTGYKFNNEQYEWYPKFSAPDDQTIIAGKYKLDNIKFIYDDNHQDEYTYDMLKNLEAYKDIELNVLDSADQKLGDISVSTNKNFTGDMLSITIDDENPTQMIKFYHKMANSANIVKCSVYLKNPQNNKMFGGTSTLYPEEVSDGVITSIVNIGQTYESGTYEIYSVAYETSDGLLQTYYNSNYSKKDSKNNNAKLTCKSDNTIELSNKVDKKAVTRQSLKLTYHLADTYSVSVKPTEKVNFKIRINSSGAKLNTAKIVFKSGNNEMVLNANSDADEIISINSSGTVCVATMNIPENQPAGTYKLDRLELTSDYGKTTVNTKYKNLKIIVKANDRIVVDEIGTTPKNTKVEKTNGVAKATVELPKETVSEEVLVNTDEAGKAFAAESYEFAVESSVIPENTTVEIGKVITGGIYDNVKEIAKSNDNLKNADTYRVFEINLVDNNNTKVDNNVIANGKVAITTTVPDGFDASKTAVYRVGDDGITLIECKTTPAGDGKVTFETNHFSTYIFALKSADNKPVVKPTPNPVNPSDPDDIYDPDDIQDPDDTIQPGGGNKIVASENNAATSGNGTTDAATNTGKALNTGDRAPIAALLFVMVSACMTVIGSIVKRKRV